MFGIPPVPVQTEPRPTSTTVYQASLVGALLFGLGLSCLILGAGLAPQLAGSGLSIIAVGLPLLVASSLGLVLGYANLHTRIAIGAMRLEIVAPSWRGIPAPPLQHLSAALDEVRLIRRRIERLSFGHRWLSLAIDVYVIETCRGRIVLAGHYHGELETALAEIVARSGCGHTDDDEVTVGFGRLLFRGGPVAAADAAQAHPGRRMRIDRPR